MDVVCGRGEGIESYPFYVYPYGVRHRVDPVNTLLVKETFSSASIILFFEYFADEKISLHFFNRLSAREGVYKRFCQLCDYL